ncbi:DUF4240 domain-containing protein [Dactylosporangium vinaceum]|uniref:DUF4240 domain-containing protein n=1 Tax=Dactylosporangium vinaceum TaxID=53362 RepID=A0ABV5M8T3_9ACTN|nr:DUF4240 domain-containing protein [Dactylosporangium vinaceum]UAB99569.1 DUF4240 domain-containing protein [Dactylosporangium vinaceum]
MDVEDFWRLLEHSAEESTHPQRRAEWLEYRLSKVALGHIMDFQIYLDTARGPIDTWNMLGGANLIMDGLCSGDSFWYFQPWLIGQGRRWWQHAAQNPDNLVDLPAVQNLAGRRPQQWPDAEWPHWEDLSAVASLAYDRRTGQEEGIYDALSERGHPCPSAPQMIGNIWNTDSPAEIEQRLPRLNRLFPRERYLRP